MMSMIATHAGVLAFDTESGEYWFVDKGKGPYYGIAYDDERFYVGARRGPNPRKDPTNRNAMITFDYDLKDVKVIEPGRHLLDVHQATSIDERIWITCSGRNRYLIWDKKKDWEEWSPTLVPRKNDVHHFNSLWCDETTLAVMAHRRGPSVLWLFDYPSLELRKKVRIGNRAHNIWREAGIWYTLSSGMGRVVSTGKRRKKLPRTGGFPRGVAILDSRRFVGITQVDKVRERRGSGAPFMHVFDADWKRRRTWQFPTWGSFHEIRIPGFADKAYGSPQIFTRKLSRPTRIPDGRIVPA